MENKFFYSLNLNIYMKQKINRFILWYFIPLIILSSISIINYDKSHPNLLDNSQNNEFIDYNIPNLSNPYFKEGETEEDFLLITIEESAIEIIDTPLITTIGESKSIRCRALFSYPSIETYTKWKIQLPSNYSDAHNYRIQRGATEVFYTIEDEELIEASFEGSLSYWRDLNGDDSILEYVYFEIRLPTFTFSAIDSETDFYTRVWRITHSRFQTDVPLTRSHSEIRVYIDLTFPFDQYHASVFNTTGGIQMDNITISANMTETIVSTASGSALRIAFNTGFLRNATEYSFDVYVVRIPKPRTFGSEFFEDIGYPLITGIVLSFFAQSVDPIIRFITKTPIVRRTTQNSIKWTLLMAVVIVPITFLVSYLLFLYM